MKIAVTTASGQLGSTIIEELKKHHTAENIVGFARTPEKAGHLGIEIRPGDYNEPSHFENGFHDIDVVLMVPSMDTPDVRLRQHQNIINAAKANGVKKLVFNSIIAGGDEPTGFSAIIHCLRETEEYLQNSGLDWAVGRNGLYIEPDFDYIASYEKEGFINCAGDGKCAYTSRKELAVAYAQLILSEDHNNRIYNLCAPSVTQGEMVEVINSEFGTSLTFEKVSVEDYTNQRVAALGEGLGNIIAGIYHEIANGAFDVASDYQKVTGRPHKTIQEMAAEYNS